MTTSEWDDTPWAGSPPTTTEASNVVRMLPAKAATGWQNIWNGYNLPASDYSRSPLKRMRTEQALYWSHPWVLTAENAVTRRVAGLPWHLEDESDEEVEDETPDPRLRQIRTLLEKPQANLPIGLRQVGIESWTNLVSITSRHLGLCGMSHWFLDSLDRDGIPSALLYINPARLYPRTTTTGQLVEWTLDPADDQGRGGTALRRDEVLTFYLTPPDGGAITSGMVQAALLTTSVSTAANTHALSVLGSGGRLAGLISPKEGTIQDEQYNVLANEMRNIQEDPAAAKRLTIIRGPVEFHPTVANMEQLNWTGLAELSRDDTFTIWGVPKSQAPAAIAGGLNSGGTKESDEAILMQGAVHDRVRPIRETIQLGLLDRWNKVGLSPQLIIEEPTFDDRTPAFTLAGLAKVLPLTRNQRLALVGEDPLPDYGPDGDPLGLAIDLPQELVTVGQGPNSDNPVKGDFTGKPEPPVVLPNPVPQLEAGPVKADTFRAGVTRRFEPMLRKAVQSFLAEQRDEIAAKVREHGEHIARKPTDRRAWWDAKRWDDRLAEALRVGVAGITASIATRIGQQQQPAKASFVETIAARILAAVAKRVVGINETTRDAIAVIIAKAFDDGLSPLQVAGLITEATPFDASRAEVIARTETALAYNEAALTSYDEYGVREVEAIDGDEDEECAARDGQTFSIEEAMAIEDHPNGTLDWLPVFAPAKGAVQKIRMERVDGAWVLEAV